ncbi:MAG: MFS transporter [Steroidobacteraceae bacterium]
MSSYQPPQSAGGPPTGPAAQAAGTARGGWYLVSVLLVCYTFSFIDRQILSLLVGPIKRDLAISDTMMGLLQGFAFALFYTLMSIPLGRIGDIGNRRKLIAAGVLVWSLMTSACALARSYTSLFLTRIGVGIGEAALSPAAFSMITDTFPRERLSGALSVYSMGIFIGSGLALMVGGIIVQATSTMSAITLPIFGSMSAWRLTFLVVGLPGLLIALWVLTLREPARRGLLRRAASESRHLSIGETFAQIRMRWGSFIGLSLGMIFQSMVVFAFMAWTPAFFQRIHHWSPRQTGQVLGLLILVFGCLGMYVGGRLSDRWKRAGQHDAALKVTVISALGCGLFFVPAYLIDDPVWTVVLLAPALFFEGMPVGSAFAAVQLIFPNQVRASASALFMFMLNLGGQTLGPLLPALFNDDVFHSELALGKSLAITMAIASLGMLVIMSLTRAPYRRHYEELLPQLSDVPPAGH